MTLNEYLNEGREDRIVPIGRRLYLNSPNPRITCKDGYNISVQCSNTAYCKPEKLLHDVAYYTSFELGFPSESDELINEYAEDENYTDTVYPYVPRRVVEALIEKHGGIEHADT